MILTIEDLEQMILVSKQTGRPVQVDWTNRQIVILSEEKPFLNRDGKQVVLSTGPATFQDYLYHISDYSYDYNNGQFPEQATDNQ
jgi:hypothetical protein